MHPFMYVNWYSLGITIHLVVFRYIIYPFTCQNDFIQLSGHGEYLVAGDEQLYRPCGKST